MYQVVSWYENQTGRCRRNSDCCESLFFFAVSLQRYCSWYRVSLILVKPFSFLVPVKVLVNSLKQPRSDYLLREIDDVFVKGLTKEFQENKALFVKPLTAIVTGVKSVEEFDVDSIDSYQLEVIGGNHRRAALQDLFKETKDEQFKWANVILFCGKYPFENERCDSFYSEIRNLQKLLCKKT